MKTVKYLGGIVAAATIVGATSANAQTVDWSGFNAGVQVGYAWGDTDHSFDNGAPSDTSGVDGIVLGGHLGWKMQSASSLVYGIEGDFEWSNADGGFDNMTGITSTGSAEINWEASARAVLGVASGNTLIYATGGGAFADYDFMGGPSGDLCCGYGGTQVGWTVGGGVDLMASGNMYLGIQYRYTDFGSDSGAMPPTYPGVIMSVDSTQHAVRARVGVRF